MQVQYNNETLYHYTSLSALKSIIENKTIRVTDYRFLNDKTELSYGIEDLRNMLTNVKEKLPKYDMLMKELDFFETGESLLFTMQEDKNGHDFLIPSRRTDRKFYILSMTDKRDDLAMWTGYGKEGCCVKFNSQKLFEYFNKIRDRLFKKGLHNIISGKVGYGRRELIPDETSLKIFDVSETMLNASSLFGWLCCLRKDSAYKYESEYRIGVYFYDEWLSTTDENGEKFSKKVFVEKDGCFKPQIEFSNFPIEDVVEEIIISPYNKSDIALLGLEEFLKSNGLTNIKIQTSNIKIR